MENFLSCSFALAANSLAVAEGMDQLCPKRFGDGLGNGRITMTDV